MTTSDAEPFCHCLNALPMDTSIRVFADGVNEVRRQRSTRGSFAFQLRDACTDSQTVQREHALVRWTAGFAAYHKRRSSLTCLICSGSDVPLRPKIVTPKKCIGSNARHDSLVDAMKNVDHHVFPTQPRSFHPHRHLFPLLTQFMRPRLVRPDCCAVGGSRVQQILNPCAGCAKPAHVVVRVVSGDLEHLVPTLRQHLPLLGLRPHRPILRRQLRPSIISMLHKNIFQMVSHVALVSSALRITRKMNRSIWPLCQSQTSCSNTLRTASFGARTTRHLRVVRQAPSSKEWLPSVHGGKDVDEDAGDPLPISRNLRKCRSRRKMHASTSLLSKRCRRTNAGG